MSDCIDLALIYHCDPSLMLERPEREIDLLYRLTCERLRSLKASEQGG